MTPDRKANPEKMGARNARTSTRLAVSAPAGLAVLLILGTVAFGHEGLFPRQPDPDADAGARVEATATPKAEEIAQATPKAEEVAQIEATPKPEVQPDATPKPVQAEPTPKPVQPQPDKTPKPQPAPVPPREPTGTLTLSVGPSDYPGKLLLSWSAYSGDGFSYYKLVRSHDADVTWPTTGEDEMIAAIGNPAETAIRDRPECGVTWFYRVFAVRSTDAGYQVLAPSNAVSAATECPPPPPPQPDTVGIGFDAVFADGHVQLAWGACQVEGFNAWKIVRSQTNAEPMYPENDGTVLIAAIGDPNQTTFADTSVESGQTWFYRVLARADQGGGNFIACQTQAAAVTIP